MASGTPGAEVGHGNAKISGTAANQDRERAALSLRLLAGESEPGQPGRAAGSRGGRLLKLTARPPTGLQRRVRGCTGQATQRAANGDQLAWSPARQRRAARGAKSAARRRGGGPWHLPGVDLRPKPRGQWTSSQMRTFNAPISAAADVSVPGGQPVQGAGSRARSPPVAPQPARDQALCSRPTGTGEHRPAHARDSTPK